MTDQQKMIAGAVLGIALIAAAIYYFFYKGKGGGGEKKPVFGAQGIQSKPATVGGGASSGQQAPQVVYVPASPGTTDANIVARWLTYSPTMAAIQRNLRDTCSVGAGLTVDGFLGTQTLNAIKGFQSSYGQQIAREIEATRYVTKAQADWLLKPCSSSISVGAPITTASGTVSSGITLSNYRTAPLAQRNALATSVLGAGVGGDWTEAQLFEWLYAYLKGADYFYCNKCWNGGYYSTRNLSFMRHANMPSGSKYVNSEGGNIMTK